MSQRSMEMKVGALILVALGLLAGFVIVMGGLSFQPTYTVSIDFDNPGGLKSGAPVRIAGVKVGRVTSLEFRGGKLDQKSRTDDGLIRVVATVENQFRDAIHEDARWFITTQGVLGEFYLAVDPGTPGRPLLKEGSVVRGISPPRLDLLLSEAYELLHRTWRGVTANEAKIAETFDGLHRTLKGTGDFFERNGGRLDSIVTEVDATTKDAHETLLAARARYVDSPQIQRIVDDTEAISQTLRANLPPLLEEARKMAADGSKVTAALATDEQLRRYQAILADAEGAARQAQKAAADAQLLIAHVRAGKGTAGALVMDEALYDDLQEFVRDLKHNPWKIFWRE